MKQLISMCHHFNLKRKWKQVPKIFLFTALGFLVFLVPAHAAPPNVITVPQVPTDLLVPHDTWAGEPTILKGIARDPDDNLSGGTYFWEFGDGTSSSPAAISNADNLSITHTYADFSDGTPIDPGTLIVARLHVNDAAGETASDEYRILVHRKTLDIETNKAIDDALWWLYTNKQFDGTHYYWQNYYSNRYTGYYANSTASAVQAFEINGYLETGNPDENPYAAVVKSGLRYLLTRMESRNLSIQTYGDPDANGNGIGITVSGSRPIYELGAVMDAFVATGTPDTLTDAGGTNIMGRRYQDIVQDMCDMYAWGQCDNSRGGGWRYNWNDSPDNSAAQWGAIGMVAAERNFGCTIPQWVKDRNIVWLNYSDSTTGFGYTGAGRGWATNPSGMVQMAFDDLPSTDSMWQHAQNYLENNWGSFISLGRDNRYYSYYSFAKAMRLAVPQEITHLNNGFDWYGDETQGLARILVDRQRSNGSWPFDGWPYVGERTAAAWNVIILTRTLFEKPPVALITATPNPGAAGQIITLDGSKSYHVDPAKSIATYLWDFDVSDGVDFNNPDDTGPVVTRAYASLGDYTVSLKVIDNSTPARFDTASFVVHVTIPPHPPTAVAGGPYLAAVGEEIQVDGSGSYDIDAPEGDEITAWEWEGDFVAPYDFAEGSGEIAVLPPFSTPGHKNIALRVTDNTSQVFPSSGSPDLRNVDFGQITVYNIGVTDLAARPKDTKCQLTWTHTGTDAYKVFRSEKGPNQGFVQIGTTTSTYSTYLDYNLVDPDALTGANACKGDFNGDGTVDSADQVVFAAASGSVAGDADYDVRCDFDEDGDVDGSDTAFFSFEMGRISCNSIDTGIELNQDYWYRIMTEENGEKLLSEVVHVYSQGRIFNLPPVISTTPVTTAQEDTLYEYDVDAEDPEGTAVTYLLDLFPDGMDIDAATGLIQWTPDISQTGVHDIMVRVQDGDTVSATQYFQITVGPRPNQAPVSVPGGPYSGLTGDTIAFDGTGSFDPEGDPVVQYRWTFGDGTEAFGAVVSHTFHAAGSYVITLYVTDDRGAVGSAQTSCQVDAPNIPPIADAGGPYAGEVGKALHFDGSGSYDQNNDPLTYTWNFGDSTPAQTGAQVTHTYASAGTYAVSLSVEDGRGGMDTDAAEVIITPPNQPPTALFSPPSGDLYSWTTYTFDGSGSSDPEGRPLTAWQWDFGDGAATTGTMVTHGYKDPGDYTVTLTVTDDKGATGTLSHTISIAHPPNTDPMVDAGGPYRGITGETITMTASGTDPNGDALTYAWTYDDPENPGTDIVLYGQSVSLSSAVPASFAVQLTAEDGYGGSASDTAQVFISATGTTDDVTPPTALISTPAPGASLSGMVDFTGTASDDNISGWILAYSPAGSATWTEIASGSASVNEGILGQLDVSMLPRDFYRFRLTVSDVTFSTDKWIDCQVDNPLKLGRFKISYNDLSVPLMGMDLTLTRTYDSILKKKGDFGVGWTLDMNAMDIREDASHNVFATLPDGRRVAFAFTPVQLSPWFPLYEAVFTAPPGVYDSLDITGERYVVYSGGDWYYFGSSAGVFNPAEYVLKTKQGLTYTVSDTGGVRRIEDRNGNWVAVADTGITASSGRDVAFDRDARGRITTITDPAGQTLSYAYDGNGDLVAFTDQASGATTYAYDGQHNLTAVQNPEGQQPLRSEYYPDGRLKAHVDGEGNRTEYTYDIPARQETVTSAGGHSITYTYDAGGNVVEKADSLVGTTTYTYDADHNVLTRMDPGGRKIAFTYDSRGNTLTETRYPDGTTPLTRVFTYNSMNQYTSLTEPLGHQTLFSYDVDGNLLSKVKKDSAGVVISTETWTSDANGNPLTYTDAGGQVTTYAYNAFGDRTSETDALGNVTRYTYDTLGNRVSIISPTGETSLFSYDGLGNVTKLTDPTGMAYTVDYNSEGQVVSLTDPNGITRYDYTSLGWLRTITDALGSQWTPGHDTSGAISSMVDPMGGNWQFQRDGLGRIISRTDPAGHTWGVAYDPDGYITRKTRPDGSETVFGHDGMGGLILEQRPEGDVIYAYDDNRRLASVSDPGGTISYTYNDLGLPSSILTADRRRVSYTYDASGRRTGIICPDGRQITYAYDPAGRLVSVTTGSDSIAYSYDAAGRRKTATASNGVVTTYSYDPVGRVDTIVISSSTGELARYAYAFDALGNRIRVTAGGGEETSWAFDSLNRLTKETRPDDSPVEFAYDPVGNRITAAGTSAAFNTDNSIAGFGTDTFGHDPNGNLTTVNGTVRYQYDSRNRLVSFDGGAATYTYDPLGRRIGKTSASESRQYVYDHQHILAEYAEGSLDAVYVYSDVIDEPVMTIQEGQTFFYHADGLGNIVLITDSDGNAVQHYRYDAWGTIVENTGAFGFNGPGLVNTLTYTGREYDVESGLYHYRTRAYDPRLGRFLQKDGNQGTLMIPQTMNHYAYALNNPVTYDDPSGQTALVSYVIVLSYPSGKEVSAALAGFLTGFSVTNMQFLANYMDLIGSGYDIGSMWNEATQMTKENMAAVMSRLGAASTLSQKSGLKILGGIPEAYKGGVDFKVGFTLKLNYKNITGERTFEKKASGGGFENGKNQAFDYLQQLAPL